jgi:hypothetical protein
MPALRERATEEELYGVLTAFRGSRSELENVTSLLGQLPTVTPREAAALVAVAFDGGTLTETRELLTGLLSPAHLRALAGFWPGASRG